MDLRLIQTEIHFSNGNLSFDSQMGFPSILRQRSEKRHRFDLRLDYSKKDAHLHILYRLELDLISDQDPKSMDACLRIFIRMELGLILIL